MSTTNYPSRWQFILFPAIAMLLGWGLRGYIGGGPYGAMIPGCFVALSLAILLRYTMERAAIAALFGAIGIGYGGTMTYGQTLGFLTESDTVYWGLLGCLVKGTVWGLLGGIVLGLGLARDRYSRATLSLAFVVALLAFPLGQMLINEPKLIYFSDPVNKPRDESWAGLLFSAIALLIVLRSRGSKGALQLPLRFGLWGALGGGIGFAGGGLWMVVGPHLPIPQQVVGWWKVMEFFFGFSLGAAWGFCAYVNRQDLFQAGRKGDVPSALWAPCIAFIAYVILLFGGYTLVRLYAPDGVAASWPTEFLFGYILFATVAILLGLRSIHAAWQVAITMTFFHTAIDYTRDLSNAKYFGYAAPGWAQIAILVVSCGIVGYLVYRFQQRRRPLLYLFLLAVWSCYFVACVRSFLHYGYLFPGPGESRVVQILTDKPSLIFVHGTFTLSAIYCTWFAVKSVKAEERLSLDG